MSLEITIDRPQQSSSSSIISDENEIKSDITHSIDQLQPNNSANSTDITNITRQTTTLRDAPSPRSIRPQTHRSSTTTTTTSRFTTDDNKEVTISYSTPVAPKEGISRQIDSQYYQDEMPLPMTQHVPSETDLVLDEGTEDEDQPMSTFDCYVNYDESEDYRSHNRWELVRDKGAWAKMKFLTYKTIDGLDYVGGLFASLFGLTDSEYQYAVEAAIRLEEEEKQAQSDYEQEQREEAIRHQQTDMELGVLQPPTSSTLDD